jgi:Arm DNA-binding domain
MGKQAVRRNARSTTPGRHGCGGGLMRPVRGDGGGSWVYRYRRPDGRKREMGGGPAAERSSWKAREKLDKYAAILKAGGDPVAASREAKRHSSIVS